MCFVVVIMGLEQLHQLSTRFAVVKTLLPISYKPSTGLVLVKTCMTILHRHSTGFAVIKTCITICYMHSTHSGVVKTGLLTSTGSQQALQLSKQAGQSSTGFQLSSLLGRHLQGFNKFCSKLPNNYSPSTSSGVVKNGLFNICKPSTCFLAVKNILQLLQSVETSLLNLYSSSTSNGIFKTE